MDVTRLRTLTEKSKLGFGKFRDLTVKELFITDELNYLRWAYFHCSMISFNEDILKKINIDGDFIINKPGINPDKYFDLKEVVWANTKGEQKEYIVKQIRRARKPKSIRRSIVDRRNFTKTIMMRKNHGNA